MAGIYIFLAIFLALLSVVGTGIKWQQRKIEKNERIKRAQRIRYHAHHGHRFNYSGWNVIPPSPELRLKSQPENVTLSSNLIFLDMQNDQKSELFIGNLQPHTQKDDIYSLFKGLDDIRILDVDIPTDPDTGLNQGFGYVQFESDKPTTCVQPYLSKKKKVNKPLVQINSPKCPYCHDSVFPQDIKQACGDCMAWHHQECWDAHRSCSTCGKKKYAVRA